MSEPEISRRCPSCGASFREGAFFCPQCGKQLKEKPANEQSASIHDTQEIIKDGATLTEADFQARQHRTPASEPPKAQTSDTHKPQSSGPGRAEASDKPQPKTPNPHPGRAMGPVGARIQRATARARDVEGNVVHRVQKFREISSVVLDEAGYDPSLRFVLVAAALFLLFIIIMLLNKLIG